MAQSSSLQKHSLTVTARADLGILARDVAFRAVHEPLAEMTIDFVDTLPELTIRRFAERSEMGRLASAGEKFACQFVSISFDKVHQPMEWPNRPPSLPTAVCKRRCTNAAARSTRMGDASHASRHHWRTPVLRCR